MGGSSFVDDWEIPSLTGEPLTLVLVGCTGNGKSATGNSILQKKVFVSQPRSSGVTQTCELHTTVLKDGQTLNVIDTPGLFDCSVKTEFTVKEIAKCISMAKDGIHAVLVVLSVKARFSKEEAAVVNSLKALFGNKMIEYMIIVFTGGDGLDDEYTLEDYLGDNCPKPLQELLDQCVNRRVLFDNKTCDQKKKDEQVQELLCLVNFVVAKNGGKPYTDELFVERKKGAMEFNDQIEEGTKQEKEELLIKRLTEMVELKFKETTSKLEAQLVEEKSRLEQKLIEEKSRLEAQLVEEKAARLSAEKSRLEQQFVEEKSRLEQQLVEEKAARLSAEKSKFEQQFVEEKSRLEQQLVEEKAARLSAEKMVQTAEEKSNDEIHKIMENLQKTEQQLREQTSGPRTLVLVGCTGNGKSATGNSILQKEAFVSDAESAGVTRTCELHSTVLKDSQVLNVIDTPGLFDCSTKIEFTVKEIAKCINMAMDGIHAVLVVLSVKNRFSEGEEEVINSLRTLFGKKMTDYMIIVFTGGDELEFHRKTLDDYLGRNCPEPLKKLLHQCENRRVLFNNRTHDECKKNEQIQKLFSLVDLVIAKNGGKPYTDELFVEVKKGVVKFYDQAEEVLKLENEEQFIKRITELVETKVKESTSRLEKQLEEEKAARLSAEKMAQTAQEKSNDEIHKLRENLEKAERELKEQAGKNHCAIL